MLSVTVAALAGRPMQVSLWIARASFVLIGILLGAVVTPEMLKGIANWPISIAILCVASLCMIVVTTTYLHVVHSWQLMSALLGASPGSMAQVLALSAEFGADLRGIAIVQVMRVLLIVIGLPVGLALFGLTVQPLTAHRGATDLNIGQLAILLAVSVASAYALLRIAVSRRADVRRARRLGGPAWRRLDSGADCRGGRASAAVIVLGAVAGSRFVNTTPWMLMSYLGAAFGSFAVSVAVAASFALRRGVDPADPHRRRDRGVRAGRAGHHDGAGARAPSRPDLRGCAPPLALPGGEHHDRDRGAACGPP